MMEEGAKKKGTVTSLSSIFPAEEAQKASKLVQDTIADRQKELDQLNQFIADNTSLVNLVQKLPDELHHHIMVPFGKAAFFPGRLIHTNEFLVLLGEGYYAERTSKQTIEILKRRGKVLESQIESLKAVMEDLKAESSFFDTTAAEAAEGLVEIREEYIEDTPNEKVSIVGVPRPSSPRFSKADNMKAAVEDEDFARIFSRMDELEKEEEEAENADECNQGEQNEANLGQPMRQYSPDHEVKSSKVYQLSNPPGEPKNDHKIQPDFSDALNFEGSKLHPISKDGSSHGNDPTLAKSESHEKDLKLPEVKENVLAAPMSKDEAFTGSIVEHTHNIEINPREQTAVHTSKPVSRFKMQRR